MLRFLFRDIVSNAFVIGPQIIFECPIFWHMSTRSFEVSELLSPISEVWEAHRRSYCSLFSAATAAACTGLRSYITNLSPPRSLGPDGRREFEWALFSAAASAVWGRDERGGWGETPPKTLPGRSKLPTPVIPLDRSSSHSYMYPKISKFVTDNSSNQTKPILSLDWLYLRI